MTEWWWIMLMIKFLFHSYDTIQNKHFFFLSSINQSPSLPFSDLPQIRIMMMIISLRKEKKKKGKRKFFIRSRGISQFDWLRLMEGIERKVKWSTSKGASEWVSDGCSGGCCKERKGKDGWMGLKEERKKENLWLIDVHSCFELHYEGCVWWYLDVK